MSKSYRVAIFNSDYESAADAEERGGSATYMYCDTLEEAERATVALEHVNDLHGMHIRYEVQESVTAWQQVEI